MMQYWPQAVLVGLSLIGFGIHTAKHGEPRKASYHAGGFLVGAALEMGLLYAGGFFG